ncbi:MAG: CRISPR-associated endonuclease Cas2 [Deltaproteobacteria bacterium]|nr:MAG: CRISPR-associated endonuclease Cas2 [Deltaproteobacteria bacterium]
MSAGTQKAWIVCYDICDPARLRRVFNTMRGYGDHMQFSVFRCVLSPRQLQALKGDLIEVIDPTEDQVMFVPLGSPNKGSDAGIFALGVSLTHIERVCHVV